MAQLQLPRVDASAIRDRVRDIDLSRLSDLGDEIRRLDLADEVKRLDIDALRHLDLDALRHLGDGAARPDIDLAQLRESPVVRRALRAIGREPRKRNLWSSIQAPPLSATIVSGAVIVLVGAALGGLVAWLYQPGKGDQRRARIRRKVGRIVRKVRRAVRPA